MNKGTAKYLLFGSALCALLLLSACGEIAPIIPAPSTTASSVTITPATLTFNTYTSITGTWSMDYPQYWGVTKTADGASFSPPGDTLTRVVAAYRPTTSTVDVAALPQQIGKELQQSYGASYKEVNRQTHGNAAQVSFTATVAGVALDGNTFAEQRGSGLYLFSFLGKTGDSTYNDVFSLIFNSIKLRDDSGSGVSGLGAILTATPGAATSTVETKMSTPGTSSPQPGTRTTP